MDVDASLGPDHGVALPLRPNTETPALGWTEEMMLVSLFDPR